MYEKNMPYDIFSNAVCKNLYLAGVYGSNVFVNVWGITRLFCINRVLVISICLSGKYFLLDYNIILFV